MVSETERARALLKSSAEALERSRSRTARPWNVVETADPQLTREAQEVFDRTLAEQEAKRIHAEARHTMAATNSKAWNGWADKKITAMIKQIGPIIGDAIGKRIAELRTSTQEALDQRDARIAELEARLGKLEAGNVTTLGRRSA